jgi:hypothetical protein
MINGMFVQKCYGIRKAFGVGYNSATHSAVRSSIRSDFLLCNDFLPVCQKIIGNINTSAKDMRKVLPQVTESYGLPNPHRTPRNYFGKVSNAASAIYLGPAGGIEQQVIVRMIGD